MRSLTKSQRQVLRAKVAQIMSERDSQKAVTEVLDLVALGDEALKAALEAHRAVMVNRIGDQIEGLRDSISRAETDLESLKEGLT